MIYKKQSLTSYIPAFILSVFFLPFIIISFFNQPTLDDYWNANTVIEHGRIGAPVYFYNTVSGRYFSNFLMSFCNTLPAHNVWLFKIAPIAFILLIACSFYFFYTSAIPDYNNKTVLKYAAIISGALHVINMRSLYEGLFWTSSAFVYQLSVIIFLTGLACILRYLQTKKNLYFITGLLCCFLLPGTSELIIICCGIILLLLLTSNWNKKTNRNSIILFICALIAGNAIVLLSPGNFNRMQNDTGIHEQNITSAILKSITTVGYYLFVWIFSLPNIAALFLALPYLLKVSPALVKKLPIIIQKTNILLLCIATLLCCSFIYLPLFYIETGIPFPRVTTLFFIVVLLCFLLLACITIHRYKFLLEKIILLTGIKNYIAYCWIFLCIAIYSSSNFTSVTKDLLTSSAFVYNRESFERYQEIKNCTTDTCYLKPYSMWPTSILQTANEYSNEENFIHMDKYFGKTLILQHK